MNLKHSVDMAYLSGFTKVSISVQGDGFFSGSIDLMKKSAIEGLLREVMSLKKDLEMTIEFMKEKELKDE